MTERPLPSFDELVAKWKAYQRRDAVERYRIMSDMERYIRYNTGDTLRLATAIAMEPHTFRVYLRVARRFTLGEVTKLAAKGYGWSHLVMMGQRADTETYKAKALDGQPPRVVKAALNARPVASQSRWGAARDMFVLALADASPEQICNWLDSYIADSCVAERADAIRSGLRRILEHGRKVA